jgi:hypothetical protein
MSDFKSAFKEGIKAAREASDSEAEVQSVFDAMNADLSELNVRISVELVTEPKDLGEMTMNMFAPAKRYPAIVANSLALTSNKPAKVLARWTQDAKGYPCRITLPGKEIFCENKEGLENGLSDLLKEVTVGKLLLSLINE